MQIDIAAHVPALGHVGVVRASIARPGCATDPAAARSQESGSPSPYRPTTSSCPAPRRHAATRRRHRVASAGAVGLRPDHATPKPRRYSLACGLSWPKRFPLCEHRGAEHQPGRDHRDAEHRHPCRSAQHIRRDFEKAPVASGKNHPSAARAIPAPAHAKILTRFIVGPFWFFQTPASLCNAHAV